jgi:hypothetical protein
MPSMRVPHRLGPEKYSRPARAGPKGVIQSIARPEEAHTVAGAAHIANEFCCNCFEAGEIANRCPGNNSSLPMLYETEDAVTLSREPERDPRIENLIRGRVPPEAEYQLPRAFVSVLGRLQDE